MARPGPLTDQVIANRWKIGKRIGGGSFGEVYLGRNIRTGEMVAVKAESIKAKFPQLIYEARLLKYLQGGEGICKVYYCCTEFDFHLMVMEILGNSLEDVFTAHNRHFSVETVCQIGIQLLRRVEYLHSKAFIHRDIKPDNFLIGLGANKSLVHMIDLGLAKKYKDPRTGAHIVYRDNKNLTGTARYASINAHLGVEQSRRDDLEAIGYVLLYFLKNGMLPWQGIQAETKQDKYQQIMEKKMCMPVDVLCRGTPGELSVYLYYCRALRFEDTPDYSYLRSQLRRVLDRCTNGARVDPPLDWISDPEDPARQQPANQSQQSQQQPQQQVPTIPPTPITNAVSRQVSMNPPTSNAIAVMASNNNPVVNNSVLKVSPAIQPNNSANMLEDTSKSPQPSVHTAQQQNFVSKSPRGPVGKDPTPPPRPLAPPPPLNERQANTKEPSGGKRESGGDAGEAETQRSQRSQRIGGGNKREREGRSVRKTSHDHGQPPARSRDQSATGIQFAPPRRGSLDSGVRGDGTSRLRDAPPPSALRNRGQPGPVIVPPPAKEKGFWAKLCGCGDQKDVTIMNTTINAGGGVGGASSRQGGEMFAAERERSTGGNSRTGGYGRPRSPY